MTLLSTFDGNLFRHNGFILSSVVILLIELSESSLSIINFVIELFILVLELGFILDLLNKSRLVISPKF